jgi:hypothetical protein
MTGRVGHFADLDRSA